MVVGGIGLHSRLPESGPRLHQMERTKTMSTDNKEEKEMATVQVSVPEELKRKFKAKCVEQGVSMTGMLLAAIMAVVDGQLTFEKD